MNLTNSKIDGRISPIQKGENMNINENVDNEFIIQQCFLGYQYRKVRKQLYQVDADIPKKLICLYYSINEYIDFDIFKEAFIRKYIKEESALENVHNQIEKDGMRLMYEYMQTNLEEFSIYSILDYHRMLYSKAEYAEYAGHFRNEDAYINGKNTELTPWTMIWSEIRRLNQETNELIKISQKIKNTKNLDKMFDYINRCIELKCKIIRIHPFIDGNGRTMRCFLNKLFELGGIPPVYIKQKEKTEYINAMNKANHDDYKDIIQFYYYKICDSLVELDINERLRDEKTKVNIYK